jgi:outer membrane protein assembly factor BamB
MARGFAAVIALAAGCLLLGCGTRQRSQTRISDWLTYGNGPERLGYTSGEIQIQGLRQVWSRQLNGHVTSQPLVAHNLGRSRRLTIFAATSAGRVYALNASGRVLWQRRLGHIKHTCKQLPEYGITGTPVIDPAGETLYAADARGDLHALDLRTGHERTRFRLYSDFRKELVWGALTFVRGSVYVPTASYCDAAPMEGKLIRVRVPEGRLTRWISVSSHAGGGGGIWGWGGISYDKHSDSLLAATGNALGPTESAGYGERVVELTRGLRVRGSNHPPDISGGLDLDFAGSPLVVEAAGCGRLVVTQNKNGRLYAWQGGQLSRAPLWTLEVAPFVVGNTPPALGQPAYAPPLRSFYIVSSSRATRVVVTPDCRPRIAWSVPLNTVFLLNGSPTIAKDTVWFSQAIPGSRRIRPGLVVGLNASSGVVRFRALIDSIALAAPSVLDGRVYVASFAGTLYCFGVR